MYSTAKEFCENTKKFLETIACGEEVIITSSGKPYAKLIPFNEEKKNIGKDDELFGIWKNREDLKNVNSYVRRKRKNRIK